MFIGQHDGLCPEAQLHSMSEWAGGFSTEKNGLNGFGHCVLCFSQLVAQLLHIMFGRNVIELVK